MLWMPTLFVASGSGSRSGRSALRGTAAGDAAFDSFIADRQPAEDDAWFSTPAPIATFLAAAALGLCVGLVAVPQAVHGKGQPLQNLPERSNPEAWTWKDRLRVELMEQDQVREELATIRARLADPSYNFPKEQRVADAMKMMREIAPKELADSEKKPVDMGVVVPRDVTVNLPEPEL